MKTKKIKWLFPKYIAKKVREFFVDFLIPGIQYGWWFFMCHLRNIGSCILVLAFSVALLVPHYTLEKSPKKWLHFTEDPQSMESNNFSLPSDMTGHALYDVLVTAFSQYGFVEGGYGDGFGKNDEVDLNLTKYGLWYADAYSSGVTATWYTEGAWCAMYVSWCAAEAGIPTDVIPHFASCDDGMQWYINNGEWYWSKAHANLFGNGKYGTPQPGDIVFYSGLGAGFDGYDSTHVGFVYDVDDTYLYAIEGNSNDMCETRARALNDPYVVGFARPDYSYNGESPYPVYYAHFTEATCIKISAVLLILGSVLVIWSIIRRLYHIRVAAKALAVSTSITS